MKKIVIFGATGNIGVYLSDYCSEFLDPTEYKIIAVGRKKTNFFAKKGIEYFPIDITHEEDFKNLPTDNIYAVINLTGILPAYHKDFNPFEYTDTNINGSLRILEYARKNNAKKVIYTQTWSDLAGYWGKEEILKPTFTRKLIYTGDHAFYSITKSMIVDTMEFYKQEYGIAAFVFRLPNVYLYNPLKVYYVDGKERKIAYRYMIEKVARGEDIEMWGNPDAFKDILYVKDLCQMIFKAILSDVNGGIYNAGTGIKTTLREQIQGIIEVFAPEGSNPQIIEKPGENSFISFVMDIDNIVSDLGYEPKYTYLEYLKDYKKEREAKRFDEIWSS